jgi:hypothetical protein
MSRYATQFGDKLANFKLWQMTAVSSSAFPELLKFAEIKHSRVGPEFQAVVAATGALHTRRSAGASTRRRVCHEN